ncbi:MAG: DNA primase [Ignavibacteriales bacterium]|nr:DNA primase [Ignavibacteriales bacterium]
MRFSPDKIEEVRLATDIVEIIGSHVQLKRRGKNYTGLCPFHVEKTPSFSVSAEKQMFYCFGCGKGGNAFSFMMEYEKVSFQEAVRALAEKAGIALPVYESEQEAQANQFEELYLVCQKTARFFYQNLTETVEGKLALEYFHHRGFKDETIRQFGLGYSMNTWDSLIKFAEKENISTDVLLQAGLVRKKEDGSFYDYFRGRAMFPIFSPTGRVIGFGARKMREDDAIAGKYINSPETQIYNKSKVLYGLFQAKDALREYDNAILVEGYADLITSFQSGVKNVVASSGTALTPEQIHLLSRYAKKVTIVYDADSAGSKAALRGVDIILERGLDVRVAALPEGEDPDSFVKMQGGEALQSLIDTGVSFIDFMAQAFEHQGMFDSPEGQAQAVRTIVQSIAKIKDELKRDFFIKHLAEKYRLYETTLYRELEKSLAEEKRRVQLFTESERVISSTTISRNAIAPQKISETAISPHERDLLQAMLDGGNSVVQFVFSHISVDEIFHLQLRELARHLLVAVEEGRTIEPSAFIDELEDEQLKQFVATIIFAKYQLSKKWNESVNIEQGEPLRIATDAIVHLKKKVFDKLIEENQQGLKDAVQRGEDVVPYLERNKKFIEQKKGLDVRGLEESA